MSLKHLDPSTLSDFFLEGEIRLANLEVAHALRDLRNSNPRSQDHVGDELAEKARSAERYLAALLDERGRRVRENNYAPRVPPQARHLSLKPGSGRPEVVARISPQVTAVDEEPESVPIIVFDSGVARRWRPGDPIH